MDLWKPCLPGLVLGAHWSWAGKCSLKAVFDPFLDTASTLQICCKHSCNSSPSWMPKYNKHCCYVHPRRESLPWESFSKDLELPGLLFCLLNIPPSLKYLSSRWINKKVPSQAFQTDEEETSASQENGIPLRLLPEKLRWEKGNKNRRIQADKAVLPHKQHPAFKDISKDLEQAQRHTWNKETDGKSELNSRASLEQHIKPQHHS